ncbi:MAG: signal peptidase I [Thermoanaerobaculia bacterium]
MDALLPPAELSRGPAARTAAAPVLHRERGALALARSVLVALLLALFVRAFLLEVVSVPSESMVPTLVPGDQVVVNRFLYSGPRFGLLPRRPVERGDVLLFRPPFDRRLKFVKRCAGLPGDWEDGGVLPPGVLWMEGDARLLSFDSRRFGPVPDEDVLGRVVAVLWSRSDAGGGERRILRQVR